MQQPFLHSGDTRATYGYSIQATQDRHHEEPPEDAAQGQGPPIWRPGRTPNYKPTPLRWPFISAVIAALLVAIVLVVVAEKQMPNSNSSATILGIHPNATQPVRRLARQEASNTFIPMVGRAVSVTPAVTTTEALPSTDPLPSILSSVSGSVSTTPWPFRGRFVASGEPEVHESSVNSAGFRVPVVASETTTRPGPSISDSVPETMTLSIHSSWAVSSTASTAPGAVTGSSLTTPPASNSPPIGLPSGARLVPVSISVSTFTTNITVPVSTVTATSVFTTIRTVSYTSVSTYSTTIVSTATNAGQTTLQSFFTINGTPGSSPVMTSTQTQAIRTTVVAGMTTAIVGASTLSATGTVTRTSTMTGVIIPSVGEVTITYYDTIYPARTLPVTEPPKPVKVTGVEVIDATTAMVVQAQGPVVLVVPADEVQTRVLEQDVTTVVERVGGSVVTNIVVITPSPGVLVAVVTTVGGIPMTIVNTPDPVTAAGQPVTYTVVNNVGGTPVTQAVVTTPAGPPFQPITYTIARDVGGTLVTEVVVTTPTEAPGQPITYTAVDIIGGTPVPQVVVTTPAGAPFQPVSYTIITNIGGTPTVVAITPGPTTVVETINGTPVTRVTTPPVTSFTTTAGATLTTQVLVTTPTGAEPFTLTLVSTSGGTLTTRTRTISLTTLVTTISGSLRTITSTPSAVTSFSTRPRSTRTFTSTSTPTASATSGEDPAPSVIGSTRVFRWTEADIFVGTFLPPLLAVALVIPLRIIDLNAKLYQPFQALARQGGGLGANTLLLQYTGLMGFLTPVVTLLQGHPVPFLTTVMVGCASFMVPLAAEAIGLKLHGECYLNTASPTCGPALGVSPVPAHALLGLLAVVIVLLLVVLFFMRRWVTGLHANPWNMAGIASLAGSPDVRIRQDSETAMRRAVADKQYGLGYFQNAQGREEYGIILMDESGRGLQARSRSRSREADSGSDILDTHAAIAKGRPLGKHLPFMALRYPWRITLVLFQLAVLVFIIYYHAYYRGGIRDNGRLWLFLNANTIGVRFVSAAIGVTIAFCWQTFFLSVSTMTAYHLLSTTPQPAATSILLSPHTNPFAGLWSSAAAHRHPFPACVALAAVLSEFLPVLLANIPFHPAQTAAAATACAALAGLFLVLMLAVLAYSLLRVRYPPMPADPRCVAGVLFYVSQSRMVVELDDFAGVSRLGGEERTARIAGRGRRYFYGFLVGASWRRLGVDCDDNGG
ncbi:hypothetical protein BT67DRAFT_360082, partial [Trichocladium antarcticum]